MARQADLHLVGLTLHFDPKQSQLPFCRSSALAASDGRKFRTGDSSQTFDRQALSVSQRPRPLSLMAFWTMEYQAAADVLWQITRLT